MRKRFCLLPALALALLCACSKGAAKTPPTRPADFTSTERQFNTPADGDTIAIFDTSSGEVRAVLYPDAAPMAVYNFVGLARSGYYDNTTIWRSEYGFAVQGGDATGTGTGGSTIWSNNPYPPEASADLKHYAGALCAAFAAGGDVTGGNSQFYFVTALPDSVSSGDQQTELTQNGYTDAQVAAYAGAGGGQVDVVQAPGHAALLRGAACGFRRAAGSRRCHRGGWGRPSRHHRRRPRPAAGTRRCRRRRRQRPVRRTCRCRRRRR